MTWEGEGRISVGNDCGENGRDERDHDWQSRNRACGHDLHENGMSDRVPRCHGSVRGYASDRVHGERVQRLLSRRCSRQSRGR